ncbi:MAG: hypothetical protein P0107_02935 [Nitrosomonas sp.]|nr:hypothetical protein [Nitrosomonas sp.]
MKLVYTLSACFRGEDPIKGKRMGIREMGIGQFLGNVVCPTCLREIPDLSELSRERNDIVIIGIAMEYDNARMSWHLWRR